MLQSKVTFDSINSFSSHLNEWFQNESPSLKELIDFQKSGKSSAGSHSLEELFTREYLCPAIGKYFYNLKSDLILNDDQIKSGLGTEGHKNCPGFGFTPARQTPHLFTKSDIINDSPPASWLKKDSKLPRFQACPDFAIRAPLPFNAVGEVKLFKGTSVSQAIKEIYNAARQAVFYLGAFKGDYDAAIVVIADSSKDSLIAKALNELPTDLLKRFGSDTGLFLVHGNLK